MLSLPSQQSVAVDVLSSMCCCLVRCTSFTHEDLQCNSYSYEQLSAQFVVSHALGRCHVLKSGL